MSVFQNNAPIQIPHYGKSKQYEHEVKAVLPTDRRPPTNVNFPFGKFFNKALIIIKFINSSLMQRNSPLAPKYDT